MWWCSTTVAFCWVFICCCGCVSSTTQELFNRRNLNYQIEIEKWLNDIEINLSEFHHLIAHLQWKLTMQPNPDIEELGTDIVKVHNRWTHMVCNSTINMKHLTQEQKRKIYLLCRGPKFPHNLIIPYLQTCGQLASMYNSKFCITTDMPESGTEIGNLPKIGTCLYGEPDLEYLMKNQNFTGEQFKWIWNTWYNYIGPNIKEQFVALVKYQNVAARENGYSDIGEVWREELEIPNLEQVVEKLYSEIRMLYKLLHAVVRHKLYLKYGSSQIDLKGPIPIHLLGNMWGQDWSPLVDLFFPSHQRVDLNQRLKEKHFSMKDLVVKAEDFYMSIGLPKMTEKFWANSIFQKSDNVSVCHGTAANLYTPGDYRIIMCGDVNMYDFYVIHHEMGHIEYYMAYEEASPIFQEGTNTAMHETIGDAVMLGVMTPQHLNRIGILTDLELFDENIELFLLVQQALTKIPEIPFSLIIDKYRWRIFRNEIDSDHFNEEYWKMNLEYRGIVPPENRSEEFFDAGAKFHIPDNTPYVRYFLSSILQIDIFRSFCQISLTGKNTPDMELNIPLHRCDIYGSKKIGKTLLKMMRKGASIHWTKALEILTGHSEITTKSLLEYYAPMYRWLFNYIEDNNVHVGW